MLIRNDGPRIVATDYWASEHAARGLLYLSINGGAARLLVPALDPLHVVLETVATKRAAIQLAGAAAVGTVHVLFEDDTDSPYYVSLAIAQCDRSLPIGEAGRWITLLVYVQAGNDGVQLIREIPAVIRRAAREVDETRIPNRPRND